MRIWIFFIAALLSLPALAVEMKIHPPEFRSYHGIKWFFLSPEPLPAAIGATRPENTSAQKILQYPPITDIQEDAAAITLCHDIIPYHHDSWVKQIGRAARIAANNSAETIEYIRIQPRFSGLLGPSFSIIRHDLERALVKKQGSTAEIFHNSRQGTPIDAICKSRFKFDIDIELRGHYDLTASDKAPLYRFDSIITGRAHVGRNFMGSLGVKIPSFRNLATDESLLYGGNEISAGQNDILFTYQDYSVDHATLNAFFTPKPNLYASAQAGYLSERFFGLGGEFLYRPNDRPWSIGMDLWGTMKRAPAGALGMGLYRSTQTVSGFVNAWYDMPTRPITFGLSLGRFMDGDWGGEMKTIYKPASGWTIEGFARYSDEKDISYAGSQSDHITAGLRVTIPIGQLRATPYNSRLTSLFVPFGEDKRQRLHNAYPLYALTDPWSTQNIYQNWDDILE